MRWLVGAALIVAMLAFGLGVYRAAEYFKGGKQVIHKPTDVSALPLPGTMYVVQQGAIYRFQHGSFKQITAENAWIQPSADPRGNQLVVVQRHTNYSDIFLMSTTGRTVAQLTHNASGGAVESNHWTFYPRFSPDGATLFYDYDPKDPYNTYRVDLAIFASPSDPGTRASAQWTYPNDYTGGDVSPQPLRGGGLLYVKYSIDDQFAVHSQIWLQNRAGSAGGALTQPELGCGQPALSPDQKLIAMVCTKGSNTTAELDVASFDAASGTIGTPSALVSGQQVASPSFSPDGKTIAFLAPAATGGPFQLWTAASSGSASAQEITQDLGLDATSPPVWVNG